MAAPSSAKERAPKRERIAPTIHAAKTTETVRPSRAISAGLRKMPVPIIVPTTMAPEAHAPSPRTSSVVFRSLRAQRLLSGHSANDKSNRERDDRADQHVPPECD